MMPLDVALDYADFCLRMATEHRQNVQWLEDKDVLCRGKMIGFMRRGWPAGEALQEALRDCKDEFRERRISAPDRHKSRSPRRVDKAGDGGKGSPGKGGSKQLQSGSGLRTATTLPGGKSICKPWNDDRGCKGSCSKAHSCDRILAKTGKVCGATSHSRANCKG